MSDAAIGFLSLFLVAVGIGIGFAAWRWPRAPKVHDEPPELMLEAVDPPGSQKGEPFEYVKVRLQVRNWSGGTARNWQVSITKPAAPSVTLARLPDKGPRQQGQTVRWNQDATTGEIPVGQGRELPDWLYVEGPPDTIRVRLALTLSAEGMPERRGALVVTFPSGPGGPSVLYE